MAKTTTIRNKRLRKTPISRIGLNNFKNKLSWFLNKPSLMAIIPAFLFLIIYVITMPRVNVSYADSDELLTVAYNLGVAHPPGYSLYILILHMFEKLPIPGTVAFRGHMLSAFCHSIALYFVFLSTWSIFDFINNKIKNFVYLINLTWDRFIIASIASLTLGSSYLFWLYAIVTEKFAFNDLLVSIFIFLIIEIYRNQVDKKRNNIMWLLISITYGLLLISHQIAILLLPMLIILISFKKSDFNKKNIVIYVITFFTILGLNLVLLWLFNLRDLNYSWNFDKSFEGLINHILRKDFARDANNIITAYLPKDSGLLEFFINLPTYLKLIIQYFGLINISLVVLGFGLLFKQDKKMGLILGSGLVVCGLVFPAYVSRGDVFSTLPSVARQYLLGFLFFPFFIALSWWKILSKLKLGLAEIKIKSNIIMLFIIIPFIVIGFRIYKNYPQVDLSHYDFVSRFHQQILESLPKDSVLACFTDISCFALSYKQEVENIRQDILIIPPQYNLLRNKLSKIENLKGFDYAIGDFLTLDYLTWNIDKRRVFVLDLDQEYVKYLGFNYGFTYYIPYGYLGELTREIPQNLPPQRYDFSQELKDGFNPDLDLMRKFIKVIIPRIHFMNAQQYIYLGYRDIARKQLNYASDLLHQLPEVDRKDLEGRRDSLENLSPLINYKPESKVQSVTELINTADKYFESGRIDKAYIGALGSITIDPLSEEGRLRLAKSYELMGDFEWALIEYKHVLKYYPQNSEALAKVLQLEK